MCETSLGCAAASFCVRVFVLSARQGHDSGEAASLIGEPAALLFRRLL
jgi:hypothetical protein